MLKNAEAELPKIISDLPVEIELRRSGLVTSDIVGNSSELNKEYAFFRARPCYNHDKEMADLLREDPEDSMRALIAYAIASGINIDYHDLHPMSPGGITNLYSRTNLKDYFRQPPIWDAILRQGMYLAHTGSIYRSPDLNYPGRTRYHPEGAPDHLLRVKRKLEAEGMNIVLENVASPWTAVAICNERNFFIIETEASISKKGRVYYWDIFISDNLKDKSREYGTSIGYDDLLYGRFNADFTDDGDISAVLEVLNIKPDIPISNLKIIIVDTFNRYVVGRISTSLVNLETHKSSKFGGRKILSKKTDTMYDKECLKQAIGTRYHPEIVLPIIEEKTDELGIVPVTSSTITTETRVLFDRPRYLLKYTQDESFDLIANGQAETITSVSHTLYINADAYSPEVIDAIKKSKEPRNRKLPNPLYNEPHV